MSKWHVFVAIVLVFNVLMGVGFVLANNIVWDFVRTGISKRQAFYIDDEGKTYRIEASVGFTDFTVSVGQTYIVNEGQEGQFYHGGPLPETIPNYPYMLFWVCMLGNLGFIALGLVLQKSVLSGLPKRMKDKIAESRETS